jgi:hypothetical protein
MRFTAFPSYHIQQQELLGHFANTAVEFGDLMLTLIPSIFVFNYMTVIPALM